jgi:hypothetical protein
MPTRTPSNGLEMANQKETSQSDFLAVVFMLLSQAFEDRHFSKSEGSSARLLGASPISLDAGNQGESY